MNYTKSLVLAVFAASEVAKGIRLDAREMESGCLTLTTFYNTCHDDIKDATELTGISHDNDLTV